MGKTLMILEVSRKQDYIFSSKKLRDNVSRSSDISFVTSSDYFKLTAGEMYSEQKNLVYSGGGHTVLQFNNEDSARLFAQTVSEAVLREFDGLELFVKLMPFDSGGSTPGEKLKALTRCLEKKKSMRSSSFRQTDFGVEVLDSETLRPIPKYSDVAARGNPVIEPPDGWMFPSQFQDLAGKDNFIAVIHIDGNAMGKRVDNIYQLQADDWDKCCAALRRFSEGIQRDFKDSFREMVNEVIAANLDDITPGVLPVRPIILAGDDVSFVSSGNIALECARIFLQKLTQKKNAEDQAPYSACAGVAIVHQKYPFHMAYEIAEALCSSAKKFSASLRNDGSISAIDWHIEFGQLKGSLDEMRRDYITDDNNLLNLRPLTVVVPPDNNITPYEKEIIDVRSYSFFAELCSLLQNDYGIIARGKIKELRNALKQGEKETLFFMKYNEIDDLVYHIPESEYADARAKAENIKKMVYDQKKLNKEPFRKLGDENFKRCLLFDALELMDHCKFLKGATT